MEQALTTLAGKLMPDFATLDERLRKQRLMDLFGMFFAAPLAAMGVIWLVAATDTAVLVQAWPLLLGLFVLGAILERFPIFWVVESRAGVTTNAQSITSVAGVLLWGPTALWVDVAFIVVVDIMLRLRRAKTAEERWNRIRNACFNMIFATSGWLLAIMLYQALGGRFPISELTLASILPAFFAIFTASVFMVLFFVLFLAIIHVTKVQILTFKPAFRSIVFLLLATTPFSLFGILAAVIYSWLGLVGFLFLMSGVVLVSILSSRLSVAVDRNGQRSRELAQLEAMGRALLTAPADGSGLPAVLEQYVPGMFRHSQIEIRLFSGRVLLHTPAHAAPLPSALWNWLREENTEARGFDFGARLPWRDRPADQTLAVAPIVRQGSNIPIGGIVVAWSPVLAAPSENHQEILPALQSLAALIASELLRAEDYAHTLAYERVSQELAVAWQIQHSFLPDRLPVIKGWDIAATLIPARETSGDFYDLFELPNGRLGLLVADVADKGTGAALFMALSRTLIRTYAFEYPDAPEQALRAANVRMLTDARTSLFVTVFYAVLDPATGRLTYANAGHNPPLLFQRANGASPRQLRNTGIPLGIEDSVTWRAASVDILPGDLLLLYTDGVSEAQNTRQELFEEERLITVAQEHIGCPAEAVQHAVLSAVRAFVGDAPQFDDMTLVVVGREV
jgi:serine phosphatase RsbU (regulator of sigma subunit)